MTPVRRVGTVCAVLAVLVAALFALSVLVGRGGSWLPSAGTLNQGVADIILYQVRLPRALLGLMTGAVLGLSGAALQGLLRNPLAEPGLIGASGGAALGAVVVFYFGLFGGAMAVPAGGFVGALLALLVLYLMAGRSADVMSLILAGIAINAFTGALTSLALNLAPSPWAALEIVFWMLGSLADRSMDHVAFAAPFAVGGGLLILTAGRALDALSLGQDTARSLGFSPRATTIRVILGTGLAVGALVSVTGMIGFVGLVVPHLLRPWVGHHPSRLLLPSALAGSAVVLAADILVRLPVRGPELKLGVVTALIGAPFFLHLILKARRGTA
ncbi:MAG: iron chelate uptake ABC transporter family permease subunit [Alphaproteobacteria bacterium]|nr:iron chelate uptake ABC transporter family permease subunit [Alphaproteobacteria bacterium]